MFIQKFLSPRDGESKKKKKRKKKWDKGFMILNSVYILVTKGILNLYCMCGFGTVILTVSSINRLSKIDGNNQPLTFLRPYLWCSSQQTLEYEVSCLPNSGFNNSLRTYTKWKFKALIGNSTDIPDYFIVGQGTNLKIHI